MHSSDADPFEQFEPLEATSESEQAITTARTGPSLKARAIDFLSRREHSRLELQRKLQRHCDDLAQIQLLLDELEQQSWLSDERYAHSLINRRAHKYGWRRLQQELRQQGVSAEHIQSVRAQLIDTEYQRALEVWERKFGCAPADQKAYAKQYRFMASRGFSPELLGRILDSLNSST